jgi:Uncharacterised nucleotidyltransferase
LRRIPGNCWPTPNQELLLRAALFDGAQAIPAWELWRQTVHFDDIDYRSQQLLPLVFHNLTKLGVSGPLLERSKGYYRLTWYKNHLRFHHLAGLLHDLHQAGIPTLLLKGAAMAVYYYRDPGLRPMEDFDLLVPWHQSDEAIEVAQRWGFTSKFPIAAPHGCDMVDSAGRQLDLHWFAFHSVRTRGIDDTLWESARACKLHHAATHVLQPTDHLLHLCTRALCAPGGSICWIADALWLLKRGGPSAGDASGEAGVELSDKHVCRSGASIILERTRPKPGILPGICCLCFGHAGGSVHSEKCSHLGQILCEGGRFQPPEQS